MFSDKILKSALLAAAFITLSASAQAQMTDKQLQNALEQYYKSNTPEATIVKELSSRGVTPSQIERVKANLQKQFMNTENGTANHQTKDRLRTTQQGNQADTLSVDEKKESKLDIEEQLDTKKSENDIFGRDLFLNKNLTFQPNMNLPTPVNYQLGAGDELMVDIWGESEMSFKEKISPDGYIVIPNIGPVHMAGLEIQEAVAKLKGEFGRILSGLNEGTSFLRISLGESRTIQVNIMGEVEAPGTYTLSSFSTVFNALYMAGGTNKIGSIRNISVFRGGKKVSSVDLYTYLLTGNSGGDILLREGDIVKVEPYTTMVQITGQVRRPMRYEMKEGETIEDLLSYTGGFNDGAFKKSIFVTRKGSTQKRVYNVDTEDFGTFGLQDGDSISVGVINDLYDNRVEVLGAVHREGAYAIGPGIQTVGDLVRAAEGPRGDAVLKRVFLYRENPDLTYYLQAIDLQALLAGEIEDIPLRKNDRLSIPSESEIFESRVLTIHGEVKSPGEYPYAENMTVKDLILRAGGLLESASQTRIDISRRIKNPMATQESDNIGYIKTISLDNGMFDTNGDDDFILEPYDEVIVRRSPGYEPQQNVTVQGEVLFPGIYALKSTDERLSSLIERAGGVTSLAYVKGARLIRAYDQFEKARQDAAMRVAEKSGEIDSVSFSSLEIGDTYAIGIDLKKAVDNPGSQYDVILKEGDVLTVPGEMGVVKISGAVLFPNAVTYQKGKRLKDYVHNAGGYSENAKASKVYVLYMNGHTSKGQRSKIEPGCEIVVPQKLEKKRMSAGEIVSLSASVTSVVALIMNIIKK